MQLPKAWEDELNNIVQMGFNGSASPRSQDNIDGNTSFDFLECKSEFTVFFFHSTVHYKLGCILAGSVQAGYGKVHATDPYT